MSSSLKWCEWCYASHDMSATQCVNCDSSSFLHQDPRKPKVSREDAMRRRGGNQYDPRPRATVSESWDRTHGSIDQTREGDSSISRSSQGKTNLGQQTSLTLEEQKLNAEIAEIVVKIEILDRRLQQLLVQRSPEIRKLNEERDKAVTTKAVRSAAITSAAATGLSDVLGDIFGD